MKHRNKSVIAGVSVLIKKNNKILLIKRQGSHGHGTWAPPGGYLDYGESVLKGAKREVKEEVGIEIKNLKVIGFTEDLFKKEKKHFITIWIESDWKSGEVEACNDEMSEVGWFSWKKLPKPLFLCLKNFKEGRYLPR